MKSTNFQKTISKEGRISGIGLHSGESSTLIARPASPGSGIKFSKNGESLGSLAADGGNQESFRCSAVGEGKNQILTVEHLLAAVSGLEIQNIELDVRGPEVPGLDGSAIDFVRFLKNLGIKDQEAQSAPYAISEPIFCYEEKKAIAVFPDNNFSVAYTLDYHSAGLGLQTAQFRMDPETFENEIAPARTFCTEEEVDFLRKKGFGKGADYSNTLVFSKNGVIENKLRFKNEAVRHKILDLVGDLALLGFPIQGKVVGIKSGHSLNRKLVQEIKKQRDRMQKETKKPDSQKKWVMDSEAIKKILPHRYPFLLVDRIVEMTENHIVGIKNVSIAEPFFQGHFPERPVMPGVLILEAMAQTGGILMLSKSDNHGKLAFLVSINNARFRKPVVPGDTVRLEIEVLKQKSKIGIIKAVARVDGDEVCDAEIMFSIVS